MRITLVSLALIGSLLILNWFGSESEAYSRRLFWETTEVNAASGRDYQLHIVRDKTTGCQYVIVYGDGVAITPRTIDGKHLCDPIGTF